MVAVATKSLTADDLYRMPDAIRYEIFDGELVERNVSKKSSRIGVKVAAQFETFCAVSKCGWVFGADQGYILDSARPLNVRKPDVSFISKERMTIDEYEEDGYCEIIPDLIVELISPNDIAYDVDRKRDEWLDAGVRLVWIINPESKTVAYHFKSGKEGLLRETDSTSADPVIPGFSCSVAELFTTPYSA